MSAEEPLIEIARFASQAEASEAAFVLQTVGIPAAVRSALQTNGHAVVVWAVLVAEPQRRRASEILAEEERARPEAPSAAEAEQRPRPRLYWIVGLMVANVCAWLALEGTGGSRTRANLIRFGASHAPSILGRGQIWRPLTAIYLHIGAKHLVANMISLGVFGPLALFQWGAGRFYAIYLASGLGGNLLSLALSPTAGAKAGASGSILGLLGALGGKRVADIRRASRARAGDGPESARPTRFKSWHVVAMLIAFYGFVVGTGPADHLAHVGGIVVGFAWGALLPGPGELPEPRDRSLARWLGGASAALTLLAAGAAALTALG